MYFNDNVKLLEEYEINLKPCDMKSVSYTFNMVNPEQVKENIEYLMTVTDKLNHKSNHSLLMNICDSNSNLKSKVEFLTENNIPVTQRSIWGAGKYGYVQTFEEELERNMA